MIGMKFGKLTVTGRNMIIQGRKNSIWDCICECGKLNSVQRNHLVSGGVRSCGCLKFSVGGLSKHELYPTWEAMMYRCYRRKAQNYYKYGGRGIKVCDRWFNPSNFITDIGGRPKGTSLDRINNSQGYYPGNCQWATLSKQACNRRHQSKLMPEGIRITASRKFEVSMQMDLKFIYLGIFNDINEAIEVRDDAHSYREFFNNMQASKNGVNC